MDLIIIHFVNLITSSFFMGAMFEMSFIKYICIPIMIFSFIVIIKRYLRYKKLAQMN